MNDITLKDMCNVEVDNPIIDELELLMDEEDMSSPFQLVKTHTRMKVVTKEHQRVVKDGIQIPYEAFMHQWAIGNDSRG